MKNKLKILLGLTFLFSIVSFSQIGIGTISPDASSALHLNGTNKGLILPRLTTVQRNSSNGILSPTGGIVIYDTTLNSLIISLETGKWINALTSNEENSTVGITTSEGVVGIGTTLLDKNSLLDVVSTTKGILLPLATSDFTAVQGMLYYNTTTDTIRVYDGSVWKNLITN